MNTSEITELIKVGFDKPRLYKRSVWNKAVKVMEFLADNTNGEITRTHSNLGLEKYTTKNMTDSKIHSWAVTYQKSIM